MNELNIYCRQDSNTPDVRQARILRHYIIQSLLGMHAGESLWSETRAIYFDREIV